MIRKLLMSIVLAVCFIAPVSSWDVGNYTIPCISCQKLQESHRGTCIGCPTWKDVKKSNADKEFVYYRCEHGHLLRITRKTDRKTRNYSDIESFSYVKGWTRFDD